MKEGGRGDRRESDNPTTPRVGVPDKIISPKIRAEDKNTREERGEREKEKDVLPEISDNPTTPSVGVPDKIISPKIRAEDKNTRHNDIIEKRTRPFMAELSSAV